MDDIYLNIIHMFPGSEFPLSPLLKLDDDLAPAEEDNMDTLRLFCQVLTNDPTLNRLFPVKIDKTESVGDLKDTIKEKNRPKLDDFAAQQLDLFHVSIPVDQDITIADIFGKEPLRPAEDLSKVFPDPPDKRHLHIVVRLPDTGECGFNLIHPSYPRLPPYFPDPVTPPQSYCTSMYSS